jgi:hypothetical protein
MTSLDKLNVSQLSPHEALFSTLKNENISAEDYQLSVVERSGVPSLEKWTLSYHAR